jgi:hypothetical protein
MPPEVDAGAADGDLTTPRSLTAVAVIVFLALTVAYLLLVHLFGVNLAYRDQWSDVQLVGSSYSGHLSFGDLWSLHNENRVLFPNLFVLFLSRTTHLNVVVEEYASAVLLLVSIVLLVVAHRRRLGPIPWLYYCPVAVVMLSVVQYQNTLWGFQFAWYLVLACFALTVFLLDRADLPWPVLALAIAVGVIGSFSSLQGLIIWPAGLLVLWFRHRRGGFAATWIVSAAITTVLYFVHGDLNSGGASKYAVQHPLAAARFYLALLGDVLGSDVQTSGAATLAVELFGLVMLIVAVWAIVLVCRGQLAPQGGPLAVALLCFGLLFAAFVTGSRAIAGLPAAGQSRYRTFDLLIVAAFLLLVVEEAVHRRSMRHLRTDGPATSGGTPAFASAPVRRGLTRRAVGVFVGVAIAIAGLQIAFGLPEGIAGARSYHAGQVEGARVLADISHYPDSFVASALGIFQSPTFIRRMAGVLQRHRLSMFATDTAARYRALGPIALPAPSLRIIVPSAHAVITGTAKLDLVIADEFKVTKVSYEVTGEGRTRVFVSAGKRFAYGWGGMWQTAAFADGDYELDAVLVDSAGHRVVSPEVPVVVDHGEGHG